MKILMVTKGRKIQVGLDRTVIGLPYPKLITSNGTNASSEELNIYDAQKKQFHSKMEHIKSVILMGHHYLPKKSNKDLRRYLVRSEIDGTHLCTFSLGFSWGTGVINFEFNPSKLTSDNFSEIAGLLTNAFFDHYDELFAQGVVSHAEFYADVAGEEFSNLVLIDSGRRTPKGYKGTTYHGTRNSPLVTTLYDKAKQQNSDGQLVRIEARLNRRDISLRDLVEQDLFNPLSTCVLVEAAAMQSLSKKWKCPLLANDIIELGLYRAVVNKHSRKAILAYLREQMVSWWQPEVFWAAHRKLLLKLRPGHAGVFG
jgi:hypothetical protein